MDHISHTSRLIVRPFTWGDITPAYLGWLSDPVVTRYSNQRFRRHDRSSATDYFLSFEDTGNLFLLIERKADARPIGTMTAYISRPHGTADIGIMIGDRSIWGQGYGQEAWNLMLGRLLSEPGMRKVTGGAAATNTAMLRIMQSSGMAHEATRRAQEIIDGMPVDIHYYCRFA